MSFFRVGLIAALLWSGAGAVAQGPGVGSSTVYPDAPVPQPNQVEPEGATLKGLPLAILRDQGHIWTSPARIRAHDLVWLVPFAAATGASIATDEYTLETVVSHDTNFNKANVNTSNVLVGGLLGAPVVLFGVGQWKGNDRAREAGLLAGEAVVDSLIVEQGMKLIFWRERPTANHFEGRFFQGSAGVDSSFPSSHSMLAWSSAAVIAEEYPSRWAKLAVYSAATGVSLTRVLGQEHFPTDVLAGSVAGWLVGHYVFRSHHRQSLDRR